MYSAQVTHEKKCNDDYNNHHRHYHKDADDDDDNIDCNFYSSKGGLHYLKLRLGKITKVQNCMHF